MIRPAGKETREVRAKILQCPYCGYHQPQEPKVEELFSYGPGRCPSCHCPVWTGTVVKVYTEGGLRYMKWLQSRQNYKEIDNADKIVS